jgi:hypothetical protein
MEDTETRAEELYDPAASSEGPLGASLPPGFPDPVTAPGTLPSKEFQEKAFEYISDWCKASADFVAKKTDRWKLLEDLYHNRRDLNSWSASRGLAPSENLAGLRKRSATSKERWQADIILAPSYLVDSWVDRAYQAIFGGPDWLSVLPVFAPGAGDEDIRFPMSYKLQELLLSRLAQGQIHVRLYEILQSLVLYGSVYAKVFWYSKDVTRHLWNHETLEVIDAEERIYDCPIVQVIPLDRILVDWTANHGDVQRHGGIGHRVDRTYEQILEKFSRRVYNLNRSEFLRRWKDASAEAQPEAEGLARDADSENLDQEVIRRLTVWEWHGEVPTEDGHRECICTIVTERGSKTPQDGVMVRLAEAPVLWSGLRPFLAAHYTPLPGPFGMGAVESNLDLIHSISQFISQSQDNARLTANAQLIVRRGSSAARQIGAENDTVYPGKVWTVDDPGDIQPFPPLNFPQQDVNSLINYLNGLLEKRTTVSDMTLGVSTRSKSATEAHILQEAALAPFTTRSDLFARSFLEPLGTLALSMLQQFLLDDQFITVRDSGGMEIPLVVTPEEIQSGQYRVVATVTRQESTRLAKAQSIERALPNLAKFQPMLAEEGVRISFSELLKRYLDLIGVDGADRIFNRIAATGPDSRDETDSGPGGSAPEFGLSDLEDAPSPNASPRPLVENGGPMGPEPTDANALAQLLQMQAGDAADGAPRG